MIEKITQKQAEEMLKRGEIVWLDTKVYPLNPSDPLRSIERPALEIGANYIVLEVLRENPSMPKFNDYQVDYYRAKSRATLLIPEKVPQNEYRVPQTL